jgi:hypothetical protein
MPQPWTVKLDLLSWGYRPPNSFLQHQYVCIVLSASLQACGVLFPFAISTSICRSSATICSGLCFFIGMSSSPLV